MYNDIINKVVSNMTVKMTRLRNGIVIVLLIEFVLALLGYIFISSKTSLVLATYIFIKNIIIILYFSTLKIKEEFLIFIY